jgi:hypothetical protein
MTAEEARELTDRANNVGSGKVKLLLDMWEGAITDAAKQGLRVATSDQLDTPRTPIPNTARINALEELKRRGFSVKTIDSAKNEDIIEVSW